MSAPIGLTRDARHTYTRHYPPAEPVVMPGVTSILSVLAKPALLNWYGKVAAEWAVDNVEQLVRMVADFGREGAIAAVSSRAQGVRDGKAGIGSRAHQAVEHYLAGARHAPDAEVKPYLTQFRRFEREWKFQGEWSEAMICSESMDYGGTLDLIGQLRKGRALRALIDVKTGSYVAPEHGLQLAAYGAADYIGKPGSTDRWRLGSFDLYAVLQLQPTEYRLIPYAVTPATVAAFQAARELHRWTQGEARRIAGQPLTERMVKVA